MEPPDGAVLADGWWRYAPDVAPMPELVLANSGAAGSWTICTEDGCSALATDGGPLHLRPCDR